MSGAECEACAALPWYDSYGKSGSRCHAHLRDLHAELARLQAEFDRLFSDFRAASLELDARDGTHTWDAVAETVEGWREYDKVRSQLGGAAPKEEGA